MAGSWDQSCTSLCDTGVCGNVLPAVKDGFNMVHRDTSEIHAWPARVVCLLAWSLRGLCVPVSVL